MFVLRSKEVAATKRCCKGYLEGSEVLIIARQTIIFFFLGGPKSKSAYNQNTDSESACDDDRVRISPTCDEDNPTHDVTQRDLVYGTPPSKRAKLYFQPCFDATFNPSRISGAERVLAPDSDEEF